MTRRDYELVAQCVAYCGRQLKPNNQRVPDKAQEGYQMALQDVVQMLAKEFTQDNPAFHPRRFIEACGVSL